MTAPRYEPCAVCGAVAEHTTDGDLLRVRCAACGGYRIGEEYRTRALDDSGRGPPAFPAERAHRVSAHLREMTLLGHDDLIVSEESVPAMASAGPRTVGEQADRLLLNLARTNPRLGEKIELSGNDSAPLAWARDGGELMFVVEQLIDEGMLGRMPGAYSIVHIQLAGWRRIDELAAVTATATQAFVAMSFDESLASVYHDAIAPAIRDAGYSPLQLAHVEHSEQIDDRIILELNRSRFVVADFTHHRQSVYFEAGYALGRGLTVIWTCRADEYDAAHVDTRQYNHIVWSSPEQLRTRLYERIKVVIG